MTHKKTIAKVIVMKPSDNARYELFFSSSKPQSEKTYCISLNDVPRGQEESKLITFPGPIRFFFHCYSSLENPS